MAFNRNEFVLKEATIEYGAWTDPHLLTPASNPTSSFTVTDNVGFIRQGTIVMGFNDEFVEYRSGTPYKIIRKDLIGRVYTWAFTANQFNATLLTFFYNIDVDTGTYNLHWIGNDAPVKPRYGYLATGTRVDGTNFWAAIWSGEIVTEDKSLTFSGTDYVDIPIMIQAFQGDTFVDANANDEHNYGMVFDDAGS